MGPLKGIKIIEMAGIGPGPFAGMLLSDLGAEVIRIDRASPALMSMGGNPADILGRGRKSLAVDLKNPAGVDTVLRLLEGADAVFEGFRPGVMEKLGLAPEVCLARNPRLVYARMTGWGQQGPLAHAAGHDINYIALTGALDCIGTADSGPVPPLNLVGDFGGGSMYLVMGLLAAIIEARSSGQGQVVDVAITDGVISLMSAIHGFQAMGIWQAGRAQNILDGAAHYYDTYQCADDKWVSVGSIEPQFYSLLIEKLELDTDAASGLEVQFDKTAWPGLKAIIAERFRQKTRQEWCDIMEGSDICFAPVLDLDEAPQHPHNIARQSFCDVDGIRQAAPAPRFSRTPGAIQGPPVAEGSHTKEILRAAGLSDVEIDALCEQGVVKQTG